MGFLLKLIILSLALVSASSHFNSNEKGFISLVISQKGLNFVKDLLIEKAVSTIFPLRLPNIEKTADIVLIGKVHLFLSDIIIDSVNVNSSDIQIGETGINIVVNKATANISMKWRYTYKSWIVEISDEGDAFVQANGMNIGLTFGFTEQNGTLGLSLLECGCYVEDISIHLHGGASWLYQVVVDALQGVIESTVEDNISKKIGEGIIKLDSSLRSLPREIPIADIAVLNITFVGKPVLYPSSIEFKINGLFTTTNKNLVSGFRHDGAEDSVYGKDSDEMIEISPHDNLHHSASPILFEYYHNEAEDSVYCKDSAKMIEISLHENVLNSASQVLFKENDMNWIVDKIPDQYLLNTNAWKWIIPQLYRQYPNDDIILNISVSSPPLLRLEDENIYATIFIDMILDVQDSGEVTPVVGISSKITASFSPKILGNDLVGRVHLEDFSLTLKWSKIGRIRLNLVQKTIASLIKTLLVPIIDLYLLTGIPLPSFHGLILQNPEMSTNSSRIIMCTDVALRPGNQSSS